MTKEQEEAINNLMFIVVIDVYDNEVRIDKTKVINEYNHSVGIVLDMLKEKDKEIAKKDRIIDKMAMAIGDEPLSTEKYCVFRNFDCPVVGGNRECKNCVKQYFERKVEE